MLPIDEWRARGRMIETRDGRVWAMDTGPAPGTPIVLLHGFPTSSWDFSAVIEKLAGRRVITFDFLGFGLSDKPAEYGYSLFEQADVALTVLRAFGIDRAHVWGHDMGTSVLTELCARRERGFLPFDLESIVLMNGSVHIELAHLTVGQRALLSPFAKIFARLNTSRTFKAQMRRVFGRQPPEEELDAMWALIAREDGPARLPSVIRYVDERSRFRRRWIGALETLDLPALVAWGTLDPVAILPIAEQLAKEIPRGRLLLWDDLGHYPQVEDPTRVATAVSAFWDSLA